MKDRIVFDYEKKSGDAVSIEKLAVKFVLPAPLVDEANINWFPPGLKHWHGASPTTAMTHIAIQEAMNGRNVEWLEKVSDEQYLK